MQPAWRKIRPRDLGTTLLVLASAAIAFALVRTRPALGDETLHLQEIRSLLRGHPSHTLPLLPGYHLLLAGLGRLMHVQTLNGIRGVSTALGLLCVPLFYFCVRALDARHTSLKTLQFYLQPALFPLIFLVFTDSLSLAVLLAALLAHAHRRHAVSGLIGGLSIFVRQSNAPWVLAFLLMTHVDDHGYHITRSALLTTLRKTWTHVLALAAFAAFLLQNRGIVVRTSSDAATGVHTGSTWLHLDNVFFSLVLLLVCFLPMQVAKIVRGDWAPWRHRWIWLMVPALFGLYMLTFRADHPWNLNEPWYVRNRCLDLFRDGHLRRAAMFGPVILSLLAVASTRLLRPSMYLLYPIWLVSLLPVWLIEPRYYLPHFSLFLIFRAGGNRAAEWATVGWLALLTAWIFWGTVTEKLFL